MVRGLGGERQATILPGNTQGSVRDAAFVNAIALYSVGLNDVHSPSGAHPGACVIPTVLAVAEWMRLPGKDLLTAMVAGYEVNGRVGRAIIPTHRERGFHPLVCLGSTRIKRRTLWESRVVRQPDCMSATTMALQR
jgi:2-methylcitrate dehydratase PrpD